MFQEVRKELDEIKESEVELSSSRSTCNLNGSTVIVCFFLNFNNLLHRMW